MIPFQGTLLGSDPGAVETVLLGPRHSRPSRLAGPGQSAGVAVGFRAQGVGFRAWGLGNPTGILVQSSGARGGGRAVRQ